MNTNKNKFKLAFIPLAVFIVVFGIHYLLSGIFPENSATQNKWATVGTDWMSAYIASQNYWLGFCYALSLAFAAYAVLKFLQNRASNSGRLAIGSVGYTGILAVAGCFLLGCCGSPMLAVYIGLFGASFLSFIPFMKPLVALITLVSISVAFIWMHKRTKSTKECGCDECQTVIASKAEKAK